MSETGTTRKVAMLRGISVGLGLLALAGWGAFAYSAKSSGASQQQLQQHVADLKASQGQLMAERDQAVAERDEAKAQLAATRDEIEALTKGLDDLQAKVSETSSVRAAAPPSKPAPSSTQTKKPRR